MKSKTIVLSLFCHCFLFVSCVFDGLGDEPREKTERTVLVYLGRDNSSLSASNEDRRSTIMEGWNGKGGNLVIYQDLPEGVKLEVIYREGNKNLSKIIYEKEQENSANAAVFQRVIEETVAECPAESYGLIVFSHGSGWLPDSTLNYPRSIIEDNRIQMGLPDFADAIPDKQFKFIVLEACLMGGIEVAYELKDKTDYILASPAEILFPGFRDVYSTSLNYLFLPEPNLESFANDAFEELKKQSFSSVTLSLIRTSTLHELADWVRKNATDVEYPSIEGIQVFDRKYNHLFFDFEQHFSRLTDSADARAELSGLLKNCLISKYHTPSFLLGYSGFKIEHYSGLTTYINQRKFPNMENEYKKTKWAQAIAR